MRKIFLAVLLVVLIPAIVSAVNLKIEFTPPTDPTWDTHVIVGTESGVYQWGQAAGPGAGLVVIPNFERGETYYFSAYRITPDNTKSSYAEEVVYTVPVDAPPVLTALPPVEIEHATISITVTVI